MAKLRLITSEIWEDDFFSGLGLFDQIIWIGLITACADDQGRLQDIPTLIRSRIFPIQDINVAEIEASLNTFAKHSKILRYTKGDKKLIQIINWWKHQKSRWAGESAYPPPPEWVDRCRYHGPGNKIITKNWDKPGGYIEDYTGHSIAESIGSYTTYEGEGEVKGDIDVKDDDDIEVKVEKDKPKSNHKPKVSIPPELQDYLNHRGLKTPGPF